MASSSFKTAGAAILAPRMASIPQDLPDPVDHTQICLVRHGETDWNIAGILQGWIDVPLNAQGRQQAADMAESLRPAGFSRVYCSTLQRAAEAADIIAARWQRPSATRIPELRERNFGVIQGIPKSELAELNPKLLQQIVTRNPAADFDQGEDMQEFAERILEGLSIIAHESPRQRVLAVAHGWVIDVVTRHINHLPRHAILNHKPKNNEALWLIATPTTLRAA